MGNRRRSPRPFSQTLFVLEDRVVPSTYYVDPTLAGSANGATVTFNAGQSNEVDNLTFGSNAFADIPSALTAANAHTGADTILLANGTFNIDPTANGGAYQITDPLTLTGSGNGVSIITPISSTVDTSGTDGALFAAISTTLTVSHLTVDGNTASGITSSDGFRYVDSSGTVTDVTVQNVANTTGGQSLGYGIVVTGPSDNVAISDSTFITNGRGGVRYEDGATGSVENSTFTGRGGTSATNFGLDLEEGVNDLLISGNVISGFSGTTGTFTSAGIQLLDNSSIDYTGGTNDLGQPSTATIIGNTLTDNNTAFIIGSGTGDESSATFNYNNIDNNSFGVYNEGSNTVDATNNYWGSTAGPLAPDNPSGNPDSEVTSGVTYKDTSVTAPPDAILQATTPVLVATSPSNYVSQVAPTVAVTGPPTGTNAPITLTVTFSAAVSGFDKSDITLGGTAGTGTVTNVTTSDNTTFSVTVAGLSKAGDLTVAIPADAATITSGLGNLAENATIPFAPAVNGGFAVGSDAGTVGNIINLDSSFATTTLANPFGTSFTGGLRVARADLNGDGVLDTIVASGPGIPARVIAFDGVTQKQIFNIEPFESTFTQGAFVSAGDINGDGLADIVITADRGGGPRVRIFSPNSAGVFTQLADFFGLEKADGTPDTSFRGGARTAVGDFNNDGYGDLVFAAGPGGGPRVAIYNGKTLTTNGGPKLTADFFVYESTLRNGAFVATGDINGDGTVDLITGAGNGASRVRVINGAALISSKGATVKAIADFYAFATNGNAGVRVATADIAGETDIIAGEGTNAGSTVKVYSSTDLLADGANPTVTNSLNLFGTFKGGVFVG